MSSTLLTGTKVVGHSLLIIDTATGRYQVTQPVYSSKVIDATIQEFAFESDPDLLEKYIRALLDVDALTEKVNEDALAAFTTVLLRALHMCHGQPAALIFSGVERGGDLHITPWTNRFDHLPKTKRTAAAHKDIARMAKAA